VRNVFSWFVYVGHLFLKIFIILMNFVSLCSFLNSTYEICWHTCILYCSCHLQDIKWWICGCY
jgi:hypothetical protein